MHRFSIQLWNRSLVLDKIFFGDEISEMIEISAEGSTPESFPEEQIRDNPLRGICS